MASTPASIENDVRCFACDLTPGAVWYAILAVANAIARGDTVPSDPATILNDAKCYMCYVSPGAVPYAILKALIDIGTGGGGGGSTLCGAGAPVDPPSGTCALYIDTNDGTLYEFYGGAWH